MEGIDKQSVESLEDGIEEGIFVYALCPEWGRAEVLEERERGNVFVQLAEGY
jgi:hypothetical protein